MPVINRNGWTRKMAPLFVVSGLVLFLIFGFYYSFATVRAANSPAIITYQGKVLINGVPATTTQNIIFVLYDAASAGSAVYSASGTVGTPLAISVTPSQGLFSIDLGDTGTNALAQTIFRDNSALYLEVRIGGETLTPRKRITAAPFAFNARYLDGVAPSTTAASTYIPLSDSSGNFNFNKITSTAFYASGGITTTANFSVSGNSSLGTLSFTNATGTNFNSANATFTSVTSTNLNTDLLSINGNATFYGSLMVSGTTAGTPGSGGGTRLMWIPGKAAFRAGAVSSTEWDAGNIGEYSTAFGANAIASNLTSFAAGAYVTASNTSSVALGAYTTSSGFASLAMGYYSEASANYAVAFGSSTLVSGKASFAAGTHNTVTGTYSAVFGKQNQVGASYSLVVGQNNIVNADASYSLVSGAGNYVNNTGAVAMGLSNTSTGAISFALGSYSQATEDAAIAIGTNAIAARGNALALGQNVQAGVTGIAVDNQVAIGHYVKAVQADSWVLGRGVDADNLLVNSSTNSLVVGFNSTAPTLFVGPGQTVSTPGRVGIGTTSPQGAFHIEGSDDTGNGLGMLINNYSTSDNAVSGISLAVGTSSPKWGAYNFNGGHIIGTQSDQWLMSWGVVNGLNLSAGSTTQDIGFQTGNLITGNGTTGPVMIIRANGRVGIGTNTPATMLDLNGASTFRGAMRVAANASFDTITSGTWSGNTIDVAKGGLGGDVTPAGAGEILYSTGIAAYDSLAASVADGYLLMAHGAAAPTWVNSTSLPYISSASSYVALQGTSPGSQETGNINVTGNGIFGTNVGAGFWGVGRVPTEALEVLGNAMVATNSVYKIGQTNVIIASSSLSNFYLGGAGNNNFSAGSGNFNTALGLSALRDINAGQGNTAVGTLALALNNGGQYNVAVGYNALANNTTSTGNVALGAWPLFSNTTGTDNVAIGYQTLYSNVNGATNTALGVFAGRSNVAGTGNVFLGAYAGYSETGSDKLYIDNSNTASPLIWGDFNTNLLKINGNLNINGTFGINTTTMPSVYYMVNMAGNEPNGYGVRTRVINTSTASAALSTLEVAVGGGNSGGAMVGMASTVLQGYGYVNGVTLVPLGTTQDIGFAVGDTTDPTTGGWGGPAMIIKYNSRVGINTTSPMGLFSIKATTTAASNLVVLTDAVGASAFYIGNTGNVGIGTATTSLERLRIQSSGVATWMAGMYESSDFANQIVGFGEAASGFGVMALNDASGNNNVGIRGDDYSYIWNQNVGFGDSLIPTSSIFSVYSSQMATTGFSMVKFEVSTSSLSADLTALTARATYRGGHGTGAEIYGGSIGAKIRADVAGGDAATSHYGLDVLASGSTGSNYGILADVSGGGGTINYGLYVTAANASTNWAGYFSAGNVYVADKVGIGTTTFSAAGYKLLVDASGSGNAGLGVNGYIKATGAITPSTALDAAETYPIDPACSAAGTCPQAQDVVCLADSSAASFYIEKCDDSNGQRPLGIVSTNPGLILGGSDLGESGIYASSSKRLVALAGRIPTRVSAQNGAIVRGDKLTYSGAPGVAVKAVTEGPTVGIALENFGGVGVGSIEVFVELNWNNILYRGLTLDSNNKTLTVGSAVEPYELKLSGNLTMTSTALNKLSFNTTTLFESNLIANGSPVFIFNASNVSTSDTGTALMSVRAGGVPVFSVQGNGDVHALGNLYAQSVVVGTPGTPGDLAERVDVSPQDNPEPGDVMIIDENNPDTYRVSAAAFEQAVAGVISTNPTIVVGNGKTSQTAVLAMVGRVPVKVTAQNGPIARGDLLVSSPLRGYAMKYNSTQDNDLKMVGVVGVALENLPAGTGKIMTLVRAGWVYNKNQTLATLQQNVQEVASAQGITLSGSGNLNVQNTGGGLTYNGGNLDLQNYSLLNVAGVRAPSGKWEIDAAGRFITKLNTSEGEKSMYALQSPASEFIFSGSGNLQNGLAVVVFDTSTREIIDPDQPVKVNLTETSLETKGLVVIAKTATGFTVKEKENGVSNAGFDWLVVAKRRVDSSTAVIPSASEESLAQPVTSPATVIPTEATAGSGAEESLSPPVAPVEAVEPAPVVVEPTPASVTAAPDSGPLRPSSSEASVATPVETVATP